MLILLHDIRIINAGAGIVIGLDSLPGPSLMTRLASTRGTGEPSMKKSETSNSKPLDSIVWACRLRCAELAGLCRPAGDAILDRRDAGRDAKNMTNKYIVDAYHTH